MADFLRYNQQTTPGRVALAIKLTDPQLDQFKMPGGLFGTSSDTQGQPKHQRRVEYAFAATP